MKKSLQNILQINYIIMAETLKRDERNWLLLRKRKDWKKFIVKKIPIGNWQFKYITIKQ